MKKRTWWMTVGVILVCDMALMGCPPQSRRADAPRRRGAAHPHPVRKAVSPTPPPVRRLAPLALPRWARMLKESSNSRRILSVAKSKVLIAGDLVALNDTTKILQEGGLRWNGARGEVTVRLHFGSFWIRTQLPVDKLLFPIPPGSQGAPQAGGTPAVVLTSKLYGRILDRKGNALKVDLPTGHGGGTVQIWIDAKRLGSKSRKQALNSAWLNPKGRLKRYGKKGRCQIDLWRSPNPDPISATSFAELNFCKGILVGGVELKPALRITKKQAGWSRIWFRAHAKAPLILTGWVDSEHVRQVRRCYCSTSHRGGGSGAGFIPFGTRSPQYTTVRDLPLYLTPNVKSRPIGVLIRGQHRFTGNPVPRSTSPRFVPVSLSNLRGYSFTLYLPFRSTYFAPVKKRPR